MKIVHTAFVPSALIAIAVAAGCGSGGGSGNPSPTPSPSSQPCVVEIGCHVSSPSPSPLPTVTPTTAPTGSPGPYIKHVVIVIQENRTVDNLFNELPGANTVQHGMNSSGVQITLQPELLTAPYDMSHKHSAWLIDYDGGKLDGWDRARSNCAGKQSACPSAQTRAYAYVPPNEVVPYYTIAETYSFGDEMFETSQGPSFPAHQYLVSGTSAVADGSPLRASENPKGPGKGPVGGCDSPPGSTVAEIDAAGGEAQTTFPCFNRASLITEIEAAGLTWSYYQEHAGPALWNAVDALQPIWSDRPDYAANVIYPSSKFLSDIAAGKLSSVTWITPSGKASDHAGATDGSGPSWVTSVVNAIGQSQYWDSTAIFVVWDDWGGWYDHVPPPNIYNSYEQGFRVPLLVVAPYVKQGYVSHVQHEFGSILKFSEEAFGLPSLGTTDARDDDLSDFFDFNQTPIVFRPISAPLSGRHFIAQDPADDTPVDTDN
jgi:phospholipase C